ncbi:unnamed protein product [Porites lobata]|uniref:Uncharacterized protein n=1 Tax=Porites lobata TaxID=104759 RepID=A0ABN8RLY7_9CNID|nr:unnamed protein product [Porites lobata]
MASSPRVNGRFEVDKQLGCFPRSEKKMKTVSEMSPRSTRVAFDEKEKELMEVRTYWQEEYKTKVSEIASLEAALKDAVRSRNIEVEELRLSYENVLDARNGEISELRRTLDELTRTKDEIVASAEKSTESKLRAKDAEVTRLRIWLEEAKKSNAQGREVLNSYQRRVADKEIEIETVKKSSEESIKLLEQQIEKLQALLSAVIDEKDNDSENTKIAFDSVVEEKERQIAMLKESSINELKAKEEENKRHEKEILRMEEELAEKQSEIEQIHVTVQNLQNIMKANEEERNKLTEVLRVASETRRQEMMELQGQQQRLLDHKESELMSLEKLIKEQTKRHEMMLREKDKQIEEMSAKLAWVETQLTSEWLEKGNKEDLSTKLTSLLKKMADMKAEKGILEKDVTELVKDIRVKESQLNDIQKKCESEAQKKQMLQQDFDSLTRDLDSWKSSMKLIEGERNFLEKEEKRLKEDLERKSNALCEFECKVESLESIRQNLETLIRQLREENSDALQTQKNLELALLDKDKEQNLLKEKLNITEKKFAMEIEHRIIKEESTAATITNLRSNYEESHNENKQLKISLDERENDVASLSRLLENAKQQEHKLDAELEHLSEELEVLNEKYMTGRNEKDALERSLASALTLKQQEVEELQQKLDKTLNDHKLEMEKREQCWREAMAIKDELVKDAKRSFDERIMWKENEIQKLERLLETATSEFRSVKESLETSLTLRKEEICFLTKALNDKEERIAEVLDANKDIMQKKGELEELFEECNTKLIEETQARQIQSSEIVLARDTILKLESSLREKEEVLKAAQKEVEDLHTQLKEEHCVTEIKNILNSAEDGFKERENVAEKLKAVIQNNAVKYHQSLKRKEDKITTLKKELQNSNKDVEDMRVNMASLVQQADENEAKLKRDLKITQDESDLLDKKLSELKGRLEKNDKELGMMEANMINAALDFEKKQKLRDQEKKAVMEELSNERRKVQELENSSSWLKGELERKEQQVQEITGKYETTEVELKETLSNLSSLQDNFNQVKELLNLAESEKVCADEVKQSLLQELEKQKRYCEGKEGKIAVLLHKVKILRKSSLENAQTNKTLEENVATLQINLNEKAIEAAKLKSELDGKEEEFKQQSSLLEEMELEGTELKNKMTDLEKTISLQKSEIDEAMGREEELKEAVKDLLRSLNESEVNTRALVSNLEDGKSQNEKLRSEYENFKISAMKEKGELREEVEHLHSELDKQEGLLLVLNKEKENLLAELGKTKQAEENTITSLECHIKSLKRENSSLIDKVQTLEEESKQRFADIAEVNSALSSAEVSKEFLIQEVERLRSSVSGKEESLREVHKSLEAAQKENSHFKYEIASLKENLARSVNEKDHLLESFEEMKSSASQVKQKMEEVMSEKENTITRAEEIIRSLKQGNESLKSQLLKCEGEVKAEKKSVVELLGKRQEMSAEIDSLNRDKGILEASLKDMDLYPVKLKATQDSLTKTKNSLKAVKGQLKEEVEEKKTLTKTIQDLQSINTELKKKLDVQATVKHAELELVKKQLEGKNKEFYDVKVASTTQEMNLREAQLKIKEVESSLKNEIAVHQSVSLRNDQLQQEVTVLRERNKNELSILKKSLDVAIGRWESGLHSKCSDQAQTQCVEKMDNKTIQKLRELYFKVSELETQLNQEKNDHLLSLAQVRVEGQRYMTRELRTD